MRALGAIHRLGPTLGEFLRSRACQAIIVVNEKGRRDHLPLLKAREIRLWEHPPWEKWYYPVPREWYDPSLKHWYTPPHFDPWRPGGNL